jgi:uncharacterized lipoprotein YajG
MRPPTSIARQLLYAAAMTTGIALMGLLAGCNRPQSTLSAPGFPHASRRYVPSTQPTTELVSISWSDPRPAEKKAASAVQLEAKLIKPAPVAP